METFKGGIKMRKIKSLKKKRPKQFLICFNSGNIFNCHNSWSAGKPYFHVITLDESLYDTPDYRCMKRHSARCQLWLDYDETGNNKISDDNIKFKPSEEQFEKQKKESEKLRVILAEAWAKAVPMQQKLLEDFASSNVKVDSDGVSHYESMAAIVSHCSASNYDNAYIIHMGHNEIRKDSFNAQPEDWANIGEHAIATDETEEHFERWWDFLEQTEHERCHREHEREVEKYKTSHKETFPWKYNGNK